MLLEIIYIYIYIYIDLNATAGTQEFEIIQHPLHRLLISKASWLLIVFSVRYEPNLYVYNGD